MRTPSGIVSLVMILGLAAASAAAQIVPPQVCEYSSAELLGHSGPEWLSVFNVPDGSGFTLDRARAVDTPHGVWEDATITVTLRDGFGQGIPAFPPEDIWLENMPPVPPAAPGDPAGLVACPGGAIADAPTDAEGRTTFTGPFFAGGHVTYDDYMNRGDPTWVMVSGCYILDPLPLMFNSADIDGDGAWTSGVDLILFSQRYPAHAGYSYSVDFHYDEINNLSDLVLFSAARHAQCP